MNWKKLFPKCFGENKKYSLPSAAGETDKNGLPPMYETPHRKANEKSFL